MGSGGNISVLTGPDGKLMVDAGIAVSQTKIAAALADISPAPLKYLINTHYHWDHTDGNEWLHQAGATIIAHRNTLKDLSKNMRVEDWLHTFAPAPAGARPTVLIKDSKEIKFDATTIDLKYYGLSHTDSDISVYYKEPDILQTGDTWWNGYYPMIDYGAGGSIDGMIRAAKANVALSTDHTMVIPGHGPVGNHAQLIEYRDMLIAIRDKVAKLKKQGKSLEEAIAAKPTATFDSIGGGFVIGPDLFTSLVYRGV
jgi:glyoxylase-like metal-dependent hydrolase (beta-lactamase superfamily II)